MSRRLSLLILVCGVACSRSPGFLYIQPAPPVPPPPQKVALPPGTLSGMIKEASQGKPLPGATVSIHLDGQSEAASVQSDSTGHYMIAGIDPGEYKVNFSMTDYIPINDIPATIASETDTVINETLTKSLAVGQFRVVVTWVGPTPGAVRDVDSYLATPVRPPDKPIGYSNKGVSSDDAYLDVDDTQWFGPETITINNLKRGVYTYYVNNFNVRNDPLALARTGVVVRLFEGSQLIRTYTVPPGGSGNTYVLFKIVNGVVVDSQGYDDHLKVY